MTGGGEMDDLLFNNDGYEPEHTPPDNAEGVGPFRRLDLGDLIRELRPRPVAHCNMIYRAKLHTFSGEPESGKSTVALWLLLQAMLRGYPVAVIDGEAGPSHTADLLQSFGADPGMIAKFLFYVPFPETAWGGADLIHLDHLITKVRPKITLFDSSASMMGAAGLNENAPADVNKLWDRILGPVARRHGCSVLVTDHDAKDGAASRYARGSTAKLAAVDVAIKLAVVQQFSRDMDGVLRLTVTKDRPGCLWRWWEIQIKRNPLRLEFTQTPKPAGEPGPAGKDYVGGAKDILRQCLGEHPLTIKQLVDIAVAESLAPHGIKHNTAQKALTELYDEGFADRVDNGRGMPAGWFLRIPDPAPPGTMKW